MPALKPIFYYDGYHRKDVMTLPVTRNADMEQQSDIAEVAEQAEREAVIREKPIYNIVYSTEPRQLQERSKPWSKPWLQGLRRGDRGFLLTS